MNISFAVVDNATNAIVRGGICDDRNLGAQAQAGQTAYAVEADVIAWPYINLDPQRSALRARVDTEAGAFRARFITDVPGQAQTYQKKEAEARLWTAGDETANPDRYPFMIAEATVRGMSVPDVRAEIMAQVDQLTPLAALIEAHRVAAKQAVLEASTLGDIFTAAQVDWEALLS